LAAAVIRYSGVRETEHETGKRMKNLGTSNAPEPVLVRFKELDQVAVAALCAARLLMEAGASAKVVHEVCRRVARGLGAENVDLRSGYASLDITITEGAVSVTRMVEVGALGVNYRLAHAILALAERIAGGAFTPAEAKSELSRTVRESEHHALGIVALAVGLACASFGRLLGTDWAAFIPVLASGAIGLWVRHLLLRRATNVFVVDGCVALLSAGVGGLGARFAGSATIELAMISSVLLLVPGVPALNAQLDIMEGHPTLGTARSVVVTLILMFVAAGILVARALLGVR